MNIVKFIYDRTLNSVYFGITLMVLIASYISIGSGVPGVREYFEMDEIAFFTTWVFGALMGTFALNMICVTITRIPLTPPRYGVWTIHIGIILLIISCYAYFQQKHEGLAFVPMNKSASVFYDRFERSIYARIPVSTSRGSFDRTSAAVRLGSLPRFGEYSIESGNTAQLDRSDLQGRSATIRDLLPESAAYINRPLHEMVGVSDPILLDVIEYYPYAVVNRWEVAKQGETTPTGEALKTQVAVTVRDVNTNEPAPIWLVPEGRQTDFRAIIGQIEIEHRHVPTVTDVQMLQSSLGKMHKVVAKIGDFSREFTAEPGKAYELGETGYLLRIEEFFPDWTTIAGEKNVKALSMVVENVKATGSEVKQFRRMVLDQKELQTDFLMDIAGGGPMGKRQTAPLDDRLTVSYRFSDPVDLSPIRTSSRHILLTNGQDDSVVRLSSDLTMASESVAIELDEKSRGKLAVSAAAVPMEKHRSQRHEFEIERIANVVRRDTVKVVPSEKRDSQAGLTGEFQVARIRVTSGTWSEDVLVSFMQFAVERPWSTSPIEIPGAKTPFTLQLSNTRLSLPVQVRLDKFEATPYAGGEISSASLMRDFKSHLTLLDPVTAQETAKVTTSLNEPAFVTRTISRFLPGESWILYQAQWDANAQQFTILGVANRPGVRMMAVSCVLITVGLLYAFYVKPVVVHRMKIKAIEEAKARQLQARQLQAGHVSGELPKKDTQHVTALV